MVPLDAFTVFLAAFLLFLVQPMPAKLILPWFGRQPGRVPLWRAALRHRGEIGRR